MLMRQPHSLRVTLWASIADAESRALAKERQKKDNHNLSELGAGCPWVAWCSLSDLGTLLPPCSSLQAGSPSCPISP